MSNYFDEVGWALCLRHKAHVTPTSKGEQMQPLERQIISHLTATIS